MNSKEAAALRKLVYAMADVDGDDVDLFTAVDKAAARATNQDLQDRLENIEGATGINAENADYKCLSRAAKVKRVRDALVEKAQNRHNDRAAMDYKDVRQEFDWHASSGHAIELMKAAAGYTDETDTSSRQGFTFEKRDDGNNRLTVDLEKTPE